MGAQRPPPARVSGERPGPGRSGGRLGRAGSAGERDAGRGGAGEGRAERSARGPGTGAAGAAAAPLPAEGGGRAVGARVWPAALCGPERRSVHPTSGVGGPRRSQPRPPARSPRAPARLGGSRRSSQPGGPGAAVRRPGGAAPCAAQPGALRAAPLGRAVRELRGGSSARGSGQLASVNSPRVFCGLRSSC